MRLRVIWPPGYEPGNSPVHALNEASSTAPADAVWSRLVHALGWPGFYPHASDVRIEGGGDRLAAGTRFRFRTAGVDLACSVQDHVENERLAWDALYGD